MKKSIILFALFVTAVMLFSATGEIYETTKGAVGNKLFSADSFRSNWTVIDPINLNNDGIDDFFFYDPITGEGEFYLFQNKALNKLATITGFRKTWKNIQPIDYNGDGKDEMLFYDPITGEGELHKVDVAQKKNVLIKKWPANSWRKAWKLFVPVQLDADAAQELFLYDPVTGEGEYLDFKADGSLTSLLKQKGFRKDWTYIRVVNLNNDGISDLFFYDPKAGVGEFYTINDKYILSLVSTNNSYRTNWRTIIVGNFGSGLNNGDIFFYDPVTGEGEFYQILKEGILKPLSETNKTFRKSWSIIAKGKFSTSATDGLMFYEAPNYPSNYKKIWGVNPY